MESVVLRPDEPKIYVFNNKFWPILNIFTISLPPLPLPFTLLHSLSVSFSHTLTIPFIFVNFFFWPLHRLTFSVSSPNSTIPYLLAHPKQCLFDCLLLISFSKNQNIHIHGHQIRAMCINVHACIYIADESARESKHSSKESKRKCLQFLPQLNDQEFVFFFKF